ncbi:MAG: NfeD family protein [Pseudomonadota bacterium]
MDEIFSNPVYIWLLVGASLIVFEVLTIPGLGILFAGLGALTTAIILQLGYAQSILAQMVVFFSFTGFWAAILWKSLKKLRTCGSKNKLHLSNMVGDTAIVVNTPLKVGETGQVTWSGTIMRAEIATSFIGEEIGVGSHVIIDSVVGNVLKVSPKP